MSDTGSTELSNTFDAIGNPDADIVIVNAQGGPGIELAPDEFAFAMTGLDLESVYAVNVHQVQTLDPDRFTASDIDFAAATAADAESVAMIADVVQHFVSEGKKVYVVGTSFGAFVVEDLLATQGNIAAGYLILVGRLDMPEEVWTAFSEGRAAGFANGVDVVEFNIADAGMGAGTEAGDRNMARLAAGLGHKRFTQLLADVDLSNTVYVFGEADEQVGRLSDAEVSFLESAGATVIADPGGHGEAQVTHIGTELAKMTGKSATGNGSAPEAGTDSEDAVEMPSDDLLADGKFGAIRFSDGTELPIDVVQLVPDYTLGDGLPAPVSDYLPGPVLSVIAGDTRLVVPLDAEGGNPVDDLVFVVHEGEILIGRGLTFSEVDPGLLGLNGPLTPVGGSSPTLSFATAFCPNPSHDVSSTSC